MTLAKAAIQFLVILSLILALVVLPLVSVYRSTCPSARGGTHREYSFVAPFGGDPPADCRNHKSGLTIVREAIGLG